VKSKGKNSVAGVVFAVRFYIFLKTHYFIANSLNVRNNNVSPAGGGGYITVLIIYESAIVDTNSILGLMWIAKL
jgi:hypothetical protein